MTPPVSDHFNGKTFFNPGPPSDRGLRDVLRWKFTSKPARWPDWVEITPAIPPPAPMGDGVSATWVNHSTFLLQTAHHTLLTDPVFSKRVSPVSWMGPRRVHAPGLTFESLPKIDTVLVSHDHYDHCDVPSLRRLARRDQPLFVAPLGHRSLLAAVGAKDIVELDWWETHTLATEPSSAGVPACSAPDAGGGACATSSESVHDLTVTLTPSRHWCRRSPGNTNRRLWGGFHLQTAARRVWFVGDSGYDETLFTEIGRRCGAPDLALIPIGAYEPRWFMQPAHMNPEEAVRTHRDCGARQSVAMHWGTFQLTDEAREVPPQALATAREAAGIAAEQFRVLAPGESLGV